MSRYERTPTEIVVLPLDMSKQGEEAKVWLNKHRAIDGKVPVSKVDVERLGVVEMPDGSFYALCTEGVGPENPITDESKLVVDVWIRGYERAEGEQKQEFIEMFPACQFKLGPDDIREIPKGEPVNLAEWVRTFGARLDGNYESWRKLLEEKRNARYEVKLDV